MYRRIHLDCQCLRRIAIVATCCLIWWMISDSMHPLVDRDSGIDVLPPSEMPYNGFSDLDVDLGDDARMVMHLLENKTGGTFVEIGANNGIYGSATFFLERFMHWEGVGIEMVPSLFRKALATNRKWHLIHACASLNSSRYKMHFDGGTVACFPLHELINAANFTKIDFLRLDVEGTGLQVMQATDFSKVDFGIITWENEANIWPNLVEMEKLMRKNSMVMISRKAADDSRFEEPAFIKAELFEKNRAKLSLEDWVPQQEFQRKIRTKIRRHEISEELWLQRRL